MSKHVTEIMNAWSNLHTGIRLVGTIVRCCSHGTWPQELLRDTRRTLVAKKSRVGSAVVWLLTQHDLFWVVVVEVCLLDSWAPLATALGKAERRLKEVELHDEVEGCSGRGGHDVGGAKCGCGCVERWFDWGGNGVVATTILWLRCGVCSAELRQEDRCGTEWLVGFQ